MRYFDMVKKNVINHKTTVKNIKFTFQNMCALF